MWRTRFLSWGVFPLVAAAAVMAAVILGAVFGHQRIERASVTGQWGGLLAFALLCGLISFAVVEMGKRLVPVREGLQRRYVREWWEVRAASLLVPSEPSWAKLMEAMNRETGSSGESDAIPVKRAYRSADNSVFGLPIQLLSAQISSAIDTALTEPKEYQDLYHMLARSPREAQELRAALAVLGLAQGQAPQTPSADLLIKVRELAHSDSFPAATVAQAIELLEVPPSTEDARYFRASQRARSALDSLQICVGGRWRRAVQAAAALVATLAAVLIQLTQPSIQSRWLFILSAALVSGPLAWTIRDVTAVIERWRR